jgi:predicted NAD-dependent protein-ADP-ribosyltransferase YbiA (DUF1768 family)
MLSQDFQTNEELLKNSQDVEKMIKALTPQQLKEEDKDTIDNMIANAIIEKLAKDGLSEKDIYDNFFGKNNANLKPTTTTKPSTSVEPKRTINVYWGQAESATSTKILSNLAPRKFTYQGKEYGSVEHAYQTLKSGAFDQATYDAYNNLKEIPGKQGPGYGTKIRGKAVTKGFDNLKLIKDLVVESFKQNSNSEAVKKLLQYENFTHNTNEIIDKAFLEGLKLAQKSLLSTQPSITKSKINQNKPDGLPPIGRTPENCP